MGPNVLAKVGIYATNWDYRYYFRANISYGVLQLLPISLLNPATKSYQGHKGPETPTVGRDPSSTPSRLCNRVGNSKRSHGESNAPVGDLFTFLVSVHAGFVAE